MEWEHKVGNPILSEVKAVKIKYRSKYSDRGTHKEEDIQCKKLKQLKMFTALLII